MPTPDAMVANLNESVESVLARRAQCKKTANNGNGFGLRLATVAKMWPTPTTRDHKDGTAQSCANVPENGLLGRVVHGVPAQVESAGSLNPRWVEWLMGFPDGWTDLER